MTKRPYRGPDDAKGIAALDYEFARQQASALGRLGRTLEAALAALLEYDSADPDPPTEHARLVQEAGEALWCFLVQREACGLRDPRPIIREYRVPVEVQNRMGVFDSGAARPAGKRRQRR